MRKQKFSFSFLLLFFFCGAVYAQESYTLKQLVDEALLKNYQVRLSKIREAQAINNVAVGNAGFLPTVDVLVNNSTTYSSTNQKFFTGESRKAIGARNASFDAMVELNWVVFDGFRMFAQKRQFEDIAKAGALNTRFFIEQTIADLAKFYFQLKQEQKLLDAFETSLSISNERLKLEDQKFKIGSGSGLDVQKALMDRNSDSSAVVYQQAKIETIVFDINRIINRDLTLNFSAKDSLIINGSLELESIMEVAMQQNSQTELAKMQELIAKESVVMSRSNFYPQLGLFGNYAFRESLNEIGVTESNKSYGPSYGIQVRFNLFNGGADKVNIENRKLDMEFAQMETAQLVNNIKMEIYASWLNYQTGLKGLALEESNMKVARETLTIARRQYELRVISDIEFRLIQLSALEAESNFLRQQFIVKSMEIDLLRISGQLLNNM